MVQFNEIYTKDAFNEEIAANASETITDEVGRRRRFGPFNKLFLKNRSGVAIQLRLDGLVIAGSRFDLAAGETLILNPEDGDPEFSFVVIKNLDGAIAVAADTVLVRWAKAIKVGA